jgi:hypothetical protein
VTPAPAWAGAGAALVFLAVGSTLVWVATSERVLRAWRGRDLYLRGRKEKRVFISTSHDIPTFFFGAERSDEGNTHR